MEIGEWFLDFVLNCEAISKTLHWLHDWKEMKTSKKFSFASSMLAYLLSIVEVDCSPPSVQLFLFPVLQASIFQT